MKKIVILAAISGLIYLSAAYAHLCNNVYRSPDRFIVKPEKPVVALEKSEELRVFVQNNYPAYLHNVRLSARADGDDVTVTVTPESVPQLKAAERTAFTTDRMRVLTATLLRWAFSFVLTRLAADL